MPEEKKKNEDKCKEFPELSEVLYREVVGFSKEYIDYDLYIYCLLDYFGPVLNSLLSSEGVHSPLILKQNKYCFNHLLNEIKQQYGELSSELTQYQYTNKINGVDLDIEQRYKVAIRRVGCIVKSSIDLLNQSRDETSKLQLSDEDEKEIKTSITAISACTVLYNFFICSPYSPQAQELLKTIRDHIKILYHVYDQYSPCLKPVTKRLTINPEHNTIWVIREYDSNADSVSSDFESVEAPELDQSRIGSSLTQKEIKSTLDSIGL